MNWKRKIYELITKGDFICKCNHTAYKAKKHCITILWGREYVAHRTYIYINVCEYRKKRSVIGKRPHLSCWNKDSRWGYLKFNHLHIFRALQNITWGQKQYVTEKKLIIKKVIICKQILLLHIYSSENQRQFKIYF